jgi:transcriptional regulator with XRE-family HTH domain
MAQSRVVEALGGVPARYRIRLMSTVNKNTVSSPTSATLGEHVRALRLQRGWTLKDLSARSGVDIGTLSALEQRKSSRSKFALEIAAGFGLTAKQLMLRELLPYDGPKGGVRTQADPLSADLLKAVELLAATMDTMTEDQREAMATKLACLARAPDSSKIRRSVYVSLIKSQPW